MSTTQPIRNGEKLKEFKNYYAVSHPNPRNYTLVILGLNTALRISDLLSIKWGDIYDERTGDFRTHLSLTEQKTGKQTRIALNRTVLLALKDFYPLSPPHPAQQYLFCSSKGTNAPLSRYQAYRIIRKAGEEVGLDETIGCHSLRKTFGYHAWKNGVHPALIMNIYNHSSFQITKRYLGIEQDDRDQVFLNIKL